MIYLITYNPQETIDSFARPYEVTWQNYLTFSIWTEILQKCCKKLVLEILSFKPFTFETATQREV